MDSEKSFKRIAVRFAERTSMQGLSNVNNAKKWYARLAWTVLLMGALTIMIYHVYYIFNLYYGWPIQTKIELGFNYLRYPSVTICNVNAYRQSKLYLAKPHLKQLADQMSPEALLQNTNASTPNVRKKRFLDKIDKFNVSGYADYDYDYDYDNKEDYGLAEKDSNQKIQDTFKRLTMLESRETRFKMGHQLNDMLISCTYAGRKCHAENFTVVQTSDYGNCFTLDSDKFVAKRSGSSNGLELTLYMENNEYLKGFTHGLGARVTIHNADTLPFPAEDGIFVSSSFETVIGIKKVEINRLGSPYGTCETGIEFKQKYDMTYSRMTCFQICIQLKIIDTCGCYENLNEELYRFINKTMVGQSFCQTKEEIKCMKSLSSSITSTSCSCLNPCKESQFLKTTSTRLWPTDDYAELLKKSICETKAMQCLQMENVTDNRRVGQNFLKISLYYEDLNFEKISEEPEIKIGQFMSDIGGAIGLWIGLSILSMFEVVQFIMECGKFLFRRMMLRRKENVINHG